MIFNKLEKIKMNLEAYKQYAKDEDIKHFNNLIKIIDWYLNCGNDQYNLQLLQFLEMLKQYRTSHINKESYLFDKDHPEYKEAVDISIKLKLKTMSKVIVL